MNPNILHYNNSGTGSRITRDLIDKLFQSISKYLTGEQFIGFVKNSRIPIERELYGVFVDSILKSCDTNHIATEFQVLRGDDKKGRVDVLFSHNRIVYIIEIKVGRIAAGGFDRNPNKKFLDKWYEAINQLNDLNLNDTLIRFGQKVIKIPLALYFYTSRKDIDVDHQSLHSTLSNFIDNNEAPYRSDFEMYCPINKIETRQRKSALDQRPDLYLYGFSIFGKQINCAPNE